MSIANMTPADRAIIQSAFKAGYSVAISLLMDRINQEAQRNISTSYVLALKDIGLFAVQLQADPPDFEAAIKERAQRHAQTKGATP